MPIYKFIKNLYMINFDIRPFIADIMDFKFTLLNLDLEKIVSLITEEIIKHFFE